VARTTPSYSGYIKSTYFFDLDAAPDDLPPDLRLVGFFDRFGHGCTECHSLKQGNARTKSPAPVELFAVETRARLARRAKINFLD
jgi:hypothetical protein